MNILIYAYFIDLSFPNTFFNNFLSFPFISPFNNFLSIPLCQVNGALASPGSVFDRFHIINNGWYVRLETEFGLEIQSDGQWITTVRAPEEYVSHLQGLCGNFNLLPTDDLVSEEGEDMLGEEHGVIRFGTSWRMDDPNDPK